MHGLLSGRLSVAEVLQVYDTVSHALQADVTLRLIDQRRQILQLASMSYVSGDQNILMAAKEDSKRLLEMFQQDPYLREIENLSSETVQTLGLIAYNRDFSLDLQPTCDAMFDMMEFQKVAIDNLSKVCQCIHTEIVDWKASLHSIKKAREEEKKAQEREDAKNKKAIEAEAKKAAKKRKADEDKAAKAAAKLAAREVP